MNMCVCTSVMLYAVSDIIPNSPRIKQNCLSSSGFVNISESCFSVAMCSKETSFLSWWSLMKWYRISMMMSANEMSGQ